VFSSTGSIQVYRSIRFFSHQARRGARVAPHILESAAEGGRGVVPVFDQFLRQRIASKCAVQQRLARCNVLSFRRKHRITVRS
jgi:hypothetical protein